MKIEEFKKHGYELIDWIADYYQNIEKYPVRSQVKPGGIYQQLPDNLPNNGETFEKIMDDFNTILFPGITHWQSPNFYAYFNANTSFESILGELLTSSLGVNCFIWQNSPAGTELEEVVMKWFRDMIGLPSYFTGVIQDTASTATLCSIITARERRNEYMSNKDGLFNQNTYRVYASKEAHSSVEKVVKIAGLGANNLVKIQVKEDFSMDTEDLQSKIENDLKQGLIPLCVISAVGTTGSTAVDSVKKIGEIAKEYNLWHHVDAAHSGSCLVLDEYRWMIEGIENVDTFVFNPHKWMFINFDFSAYFVKDHEALIKTFEILPEYLKTNYDNHVINYKDWGIQLGRRFRALKAWFVLRSYGLDGIKEKITYHLNLTKYALKLLNESELFEIMAPVKFNLICFRYHQINKTDDELNILNQRIMDEINNDGKIFFTHTKLNGKITLRIVIGQTYIDENHVKNACEIIIKKAKEIAQA